MIGDFDDAYQDDYFLPEDREPFGDLMEHERRLVYEDMSLEQREYDDEYMDEYEYDDGEIYDTDMENFEQIDLFPTD